MGRFYKATPAQFIDDKMFQLDPAIMMKAVETIDKNITAVDDASGDALDLLDTERLSEDDPVVREMIQGFKDEIYQVTDAMSNDAAGYQRHGHTMRGISRRISSALGDGVLGSAKKNLDFFNKADENLQKSTEHTQEVKGLYSDYGRFDYGRKGGVISNKTGAIQTYEPFDYGKNAIGTKNALKNTLTVVKNIDPLTKIDPRTGLPIAGGASIDGEVMYTTSTNQTEVTAERVQSVAEAYLDSTNFMEGKTMEYSMALEMDKIPVQYHADGTEITAEELALKDYNDIVDAALGSRAGERGHKNTRVSSKPGSSGSNLKTKPETYSQIKNNYSNLTNTASLVAGNDSKDAVLSAVSGAPTVDEIVEAAINPTGGLSYLRGYEVMNQAGIFSNAGQYNSWIKKNLDLKTEYQPVEAPLYITFNKRDQHQPFQRMFTRDSSNEKTPVTVAPNESGVLEAGGYIYTPVTGKKPKLVYKTDPNGFLLGSDNAQLVDDVGNPTKDPAKVGNSTRLQFVTEQVPTTANTETVSQAKAGELKYVEEVTPESTGKHRKDGYYVLVKQMYKTKIPAPGTPASAALQHEVVSLETWYDEDNFPKSN